MFMNENIRLVLFMGPRKSGKDYYAARLRETCFPAVVLAFADAIRETVAAVCHCPLSVFLERKQKDIPFMASRYDFDIRLEERLPVMADGKWIDALPISRPLTFHARMTPREALCRLVAGGEYVPEGYWSRLLIRRIMTCGSNNVLVTDCRLPEEYKMMRETFAHTMLFHLEAWNRQETTGEHVTDTSFGEIARLARQDGGIYHHFNPLEYSGDAREPILAKMREEVMSYVQ